MSGPKIEEKILRDYYELWLSGADTETIKKSLALSKTKFESLTPHFLQYCRHKVKFDTRAQLNDSDVPDLVKLTPERESKFLELLNAGLDYSKASLLMGIPLVTVFEYWFKNEQFKKKCEIAIELCHAQVVTALYRRAIGYEYPGGNVTKFRGTRVLKRKTIEGGIITEEEYTEPYENTTIMQKIEVVEPDVTAAKFILYNRDPENWTMNGERVGSSNKGRILEWLGDQSEDINNKELEYFDDKQLEYDDNYLT